MLNVDSVSEFIVDSATILNANSVIYYTTTIFIPDSTHTVQCTLHRYVGIQYIALNCNFQKKKNCYVLVISVVVYNVAIDQQGGFTSTNEYWLLIAE